VFVITLEPHSVCDTA